MMFKKLTSIYFRYFHQIVIDLTIVKHYRNVENCLKQMCRFIRNHSGGVSPQGDHNLNVYGDDVWLFLSLSTWVHF